MSSTPRFAPSQSWISRALWRAWLAADRRSPRELVRLRANVRLNPAANVTIVPIALGAADAELELSLAGDGNPGANRLSGGISPKSGVTCPVRRLGSVVDPVTLERVRLVKLDVEGWEMHALEGMRDCFPLLRRAAIVVEVTPAWLEQNGSDARALYRLLESAGWTPTCGMRDERQRDELFLPPERRGES